MARRQSILSFTWGMEKEIVEKYVRQMYFVDGRDATLFLPYFRNLLKVLRFFCDKVTIAQSRERLEHQMCHNNVTNTYIMLACIRSFKILYCLRFTLHWPHFLPHFVQNRNHIQVLWGFAIVFHCSSEKPRWCNEFFLVNIEIAWGIHGNRRAAPRNWHRPQRLCCNSYPNLLIVRDTILRTVFF